MLTKFIVDPLLLCFDFWCFCFFLLFFSPLIFFLRQPCWVASAALNAVFFATQILCTCIICSICRDHNYLIFSCLLLLKETFGVLKETFGVLKETFGVLKETFGV